MILSRSVLFLSVFIFAVSYVELSDQKPHIIIFVADDLGWNDVSYHDPVHQIPTPNIDALGMNGLILNRHYSMQMCTPSRAALMTGQHPIHIGMQHFVIVQDEPWGLPLTHKIMPEYFKDAGYETYMVGKWHLGFHEKRYTPLKRGFDHHYGYWGSNVDYWTKIKSVAPNSPGLDWRNGSKIWRDDDQYVTDSFTDVTIDYLKKHDKNHPMFLIVNHLAPHSANRDDPLQAPEEEIKKFAFISDINRRKHAAMVSLLDKSVGKVITALKDVGMLENSIIVFFSDNGAPSTPPMELNPGSNFPFRGTKDTPWEGGVRVPAMIWSPLLQQKSPRISNQLFHVSDWLPTLLALAEIDTYDKFDGVNQWQSFIGDTNQTQRSHLLVNIDPIDNWSGIIQNEYKLVNKTNRDETDDWLNNANNETNLNDDTYVQLIMSSDVFKALESHLTSSDILKAFQDSVVTCIKPFNVTNDQLCDKSKNVCLFNIKEDPCEYHDLSKTHPEIVENISNMLEAYENSMIAPLNQPRDEQSNPIHHDGIWIAWNDVSNVSENIVKSI